jgi:hypothetical protein
VRETPHLRCHVNTVIPKTVYLPRQAWDRHSLEKVEKKRRFLQGGGEDAAASRGAGTIQAPCSLFLGLLSSAMKYDPLSRQARDDNCEENSNQRARCYAQESKRIESCAAVVDSIVTTLESEVREKRHFGGWLDYFLRMKRDGHLPRQARDEHNEA